MRPLTLSGFSGRPAGRSIRRAAFRALVFSGLWLVLTEGDLETWYLGAAAVAAATLLSLRLLPEGPGWR